MPKKSTRLTARQSQQDLDHRVLNTLGYSSATRIAKLLGVSRQAVTASLKRLIAAGKVEKTPTDRYQRAGSHLGALLIARLRGRV